MGPGSEEPWLIGLCLPPPPQVHVGTRLREHTRPPAPTPSTHEGVCAPRALRGQGISKCPRYLAPERGRAWQARQEGLSPRGHAGAAPSECALTPGRSVEGQRHRAAGGGRAQGARGLRPGDGRGHGRDPRAAALALRWARARGSRLGSARPGGGGRGCSARLSSAPRRPGPRASPAPLPPGTRDPGHPTRRRCGAGSLAGPCLREARGPGDPTGTEIPRIRAAARHLPATWASESGRLCARERRTRTNASQSCCFITLWVPASEGS